jgi:hypothetical protein
MRVKTPKTAKAARAKKIVIPNALHVLPCPQFRPLCIMDSGTDLAILGLGWTITKRYSETCLVEGEPLRIVDAVTTVVDPLVPSRSLRLTKICRALHQPDARESLIPPAQLEWFGINVCTKAKFHRGHQRISCDQRNVDLYFDGKLTWFLHQSPTKG